VIDDPQTLIAPGVVSAAMVSLWLWLRSVVAKGSLEITSKTSRALEAKIADLESEIATATARADRAEECEQCARARADEAIDRLLRTFEELRAEVRTSNGKNND